MPGYRPPSTEPRGPWAKAIHAKRRAEGISQTGGFELLGPRLGFKPKSRASYRAIDMGDRLPTPVEAEIIADWLGFWPVDDEPESPATSDGAGLSALAEAIRGQTEAITALTIQVKTLAEARPDAAGMAHLIAEAVDGALRVTLPAVLRAAGLPPK